MNARRAVKPLHIYQAGEVVADRYGIQSVIASGGMAEVYEVIDAQTGERRALKTPNDRYAHNQGIVARMVREAHALGKLEHENLVKVYDAGVDEGQFFMVMELLEGITLKQVASEQRLPTGVVLSLMEQAAIALHVLHLLGHIHRDIKPDNLMISPRAGAPEHRLVVIDLGIAKFADHSTTTDGKTLGTVTYMAPEQALGERVDARADIYSLGVMMYELIAGVHPLAGDSRPATADEWMQRQLKMIPDPLDTLVKNLHPVVSNLVMRTIAKDPAQRFDSAADLAKQLRAATIMLSDSGQLGPVRLATFDRAPPADGDSGPQPRALVEPDARRASRLAFARTEAAPAKGGRSSTPAPSPAPLPIKPEPPRVSADPQAPRARMGTVPMRGRQQTLPHLGGPAPSALPAPLLPLPSPPVPATEPALEASPLPPQVSSKWQPGPSTPPLRVLVEENESVPVPPPPKIKPPPAERSKSRQLRAERAAGSDVNAWLRALVAGFALSLVSIAVIAKFALRPDAPVASATQAVDVLPVVVLTASSAEAPTTAPSAAAAAPVPVSASASQSASAARPQAKASATLKPAAPPASTAPAAAPTTTSPPASPSAIKLPFPPAGRK